VPDTKLKTKFNKPDPRRHPCAFTDFSGRPPALKLSRKAVAKSSGLTNMSIDAL